MHVLIQLLMRNSHHAVTEVCEQRYWSVLGFISSDSSGHGVVDQHATHRHVSDGLGLGRRSVPCAIRVTVLIPSL